MSFKNILARRWPSLMFASFLMASIAGCAHAASLRDSGPAAQTYYYFIKSCIEEFRHNDEAALTNMNMASSLARDSYYLKLETAKLYSRAGDQQTAMREALAAIEMEPERTEARLFYAWAAGTLQMWEESQKQYQEVLRLEPDNTQALMSMGIFYADQELNDKAEAAFKRLTELKPTFDSYYYLGYFYSGIGREKDAIRALTTATRKNPEFFDGFRELAGIQEKIGDTKEAEKNLRTMISLRPDSTTPKARLARLLLKKGRKSEAQKILAEMGGVAPEGVLQTRIQIGLIYLEQGLYSDAAAEFETALREDPGDGSAAYFLASALMELGDVARAKGLLEKVDSTEDIYVNAQLLLATTAEAETVTERLEKGLKIIEKAVKKRPDSVRLQITRAIYYEELNKLEESRRIVLEIVKKFPEDSDVYFRLGVVEDRLGNQEASIEAMKKAVELNPQNAEAMNYLAYTWAVRQENLREALALVEKADSISPERGHIIDTLGWVHYHLGNTATALTFLERAVVMTQGDPVVYYHLGDVLLALGRSKDALEQYKKAAEANEKSPTIDNSFSQEDLNEKIQRLSK